jgi:hypothetical protein
MISIIKLQYQAQEVANAALLCYYNPENAYMRSRLNDALRGYDNALAEVNADAAKAEVKA